MVLVLVALGLWLLTSTPRAERQVSPSLGDALRGGAPAADVRAGPVDIEFETLGQGTSPIPGPSAPTLFFARRPADLDSIAPFLTHEDWQAVAGVDFSQQLVVAVFAGPKPSRGYTVDVEQIRADSEMMSVLVSQEELDADVVDAPAGTAPYALVTLPLAAVSEEAPSRWRLADDSGAFQVGGPLNPP